MDRRQAEQLAPLIRSVNGQVARSGPAAEDLFDRYFEEIYRFLVVRVGLDQAEDLAQEVFIVACRAVSAPASERAWLYGIAANVARSWWRGEGRCQGPNLRLAAQPSSMNEEAVAVLDRVHASAVITQLRTILDQRQPSEKRSSSPLPGLSPAEIATALGASPLAVRSRLLRARRQLRPHLALFETSPTIAAYPRKEVPNA